MNIQPLKVVRRIALGLLDRTYLGLYTIVKLLSTSLSTKEREAADEEAVLFLFINAIGDFILFSSILPALAHRYAKKVPGHHIQVDVKFVSLKDLEGKKVRRFQYTAIDDATRVRALRIYPKHNQKCAMDFIDYVVEKFPFRIHTIRTDRGHEFQAKFHWHVEDRGMQHVYIKPRFPQLNGKVERSHRTDKDEFYQLLTYTDDVDLNDKLKAWEQFYNFDRPHSAFDGKTPYEELRRRLNLVS